jgi:hypothetical protein
MAFQDDIYTVMTSDSSLNTLMNNRIFSENLERNYDVTKDWLVYGFKRNQQVDCLNSKNAYTEYLLTIKVLSPDSIKQNQVGDYLQTYLNGKEYGGIQDIILLDDNHSPALETNQYSIVLEFRVLYV